MIASTENGERGREESMGERAEYGGERAEYGGERREWGRDRGVWGREGGVWENVQPMNCKREEEGVRRKKGERKYSP